MALIIYCAGVLFCIFSEHPTGNEAWFSNPAIDLMVRHRMGTPVLDAAGSGLTGIGQHTYWTMPLYTLAEVPWYLLFGYTVVSQRLLSMICGLGVLWCVYRLASRLSTAWAAVLSVVLVSCDWMFIRQAADGRMDMLCALLGFGGLAIYVSLRDGSFRRAIFLSNLAAAASCMTHPCGMYATTGLWATTLYLDRKRLSWSDVGVAAIPYCVAALSWAAYISRAPADFAAQMRWNVKGVQAYLGGRDRTTALNPLKAFRAEVQLRYFDHYHSHVIPIIYLLGTAALVLLAWRSRRRDHIVFGGLALLFFLEMMWLEGLKGDGYLVHSVPVLAMALAVGLCSVWLRSKRLTLAFVVVVAGVLVSRQAATAHWFGNGAASSRDYFSVVDFVAAHHAPHEELIGSAELGYKLGFKNGLTEDWRIGYVSRKSPRLIVIGKQWRMWLKNPKDKDPDFSKFVDHRLNVEYAPVLENATYTVYERRDLMEPIAAPPDSGHGSLVKMFLDLRPQS
ncbi:MAG TPA: hypothetical protein VGD64_07340 [Acidisarcina sp.]